LGNGAGSNLRTGDNNIYIYDLGMEKESNTIRIGTVGTQTATFIAGITGTAVTGAAVVVDANGQLGVAPSSQRFKDEIKPMNKASEAILALKPVTFRYKKEIDAEHTLRFGLVAEEVAKVNPDLVARDKNGAIYTVRYEAVNAMLLNEFLKEHRKNEEQQATIAQLKSGMEALTATVKEQAAQIQKVSAQLEANKPTPQVVANDQ
jgi:trimeric autotransporter adhesin